MLTTSTPSLVIVPRKRDRRGYYRSPVTLPEYRQGRRPANAGRKFPVETLEPAEVYALMDACGRGNAGIRNRALIMMLWRCGLRCAEALALYPKDVDLLRGRVTVLLGKGKKRRIVAIDPAAAAVCERWERDRRRLGLSGRHPYFCVISTPTLGMPLGAGYVRELFKRLGEKAGVEKRVHPHGLRHTYASYLNEQGVPITDIQAMLGHSSLAITERYVNHLNPARTIERVLKVDWPEAAPRVAAPS